MSDARHLGQLTVGESAALGSMDLPAAAAGRLREMGFLSGASVRLVRRAPLGCPIEFEVGGARLALRQVDASQIFVQ
ncbi:MAG: ferrous iron transport protein A [Verrucomicrobia subdivision 3 bacterium]|nr:ferrous iron transport protein A [Limisphaerales bacterium]